MNGQMTLFEKQKVADEFIKQVNPYESQPALCFDLRNYAKYIEEHAIPHDCVPSDIFKMFQK